MKHLHARLIAFEMWFWGIFSFKQFLIFLLPNILRPKHDYTVQFRGHPFVIPNLDYMVASYDQIIKNNQYHTELIDGVIVDAGASCGIFSVWAASRFHFKLYAFEPSSKNLPYLIKNCAFYPNITIVPKGLGALEGTALFNPENYMVKGNASEVIPITTIDSFNLPVKFLKMDIEGEEGNALRGAAETIKKYQPVIVMSAYHHPEDKVELPKTLNAISPYHIELKHDLEEDFICKPI